MTTALVALRVAHGIPLWDIKADGALIGVASVLPEEGNQPLATVRYGMSEEPVTFAAPTLRKVLALVRAYVDAEDAAIKAEADHEYYCEVIAPMEAAERLAERAWIRNGYDEID